MSIASALGFGKKVRYAVVGAGDIAQSAFMPGVAHTGNSELVALVTGDAEKAAALKKAYDLKATYRYEQFGELLASGAIDAVYLATPNSRHAEFAIPALQAGIHVLSEKPLEVTVAKCEAIRAAARASSARLMVAYRLHFEPATLKAIQRIRDGEIGEALTFVASFGQMLDPENHRAKHGIEAGPLFDMGPYPINAIRYLFGEEPIEVASAVASRNPRSGLGDLDDTIAVTLRLPGHKVASFIVSYYARGGDEWTISGTKGTFRLSPAFGFNQARELSLITSGDPKVETFEPTDQFGGETRYFSDCILEGRDPEPDAEEGTADLRVIEGIVKALETGRPQALAPFTRSRRIDTKAQKQTLSTIDPPKNVAASSPSRES